MTLIRFKTNLILFFLGGLLGGCGSSKQQTAVSSNVFQGKVAEDQRPLKLVRYPHGVRAGQPELVIQRGHSRNIASAVWNPTSTRLLTAGDANELKIWNPETGDLVAELNGLWFDTYVDHGDVGWSGDGRRIFLRGEPLRVWDGVTGRLLYRIQFDPQTGQGEIVELHDAKLSPDNTSFSTIISNTTVDKDERVLTVWDMETLSLRATQEISPLETGIEWSPDNRRFTTLDNENRAIHIWSANTAEKAPALNGHCEKIKSVTWSPKGIYAAAIGEDGSTRIFDTRNGQEILVLDDPCDEKNRRTPHYIKMTWGRDDDHFFTVDGDGKVRHHSIKAGEERLLPLSFTGRPIDYEIAPSPSGESVAVSVSRYADGTAGIESTLVDVVDIDTNEVRLSITNAPPKSMLVWAPTRPRLALVSTLMRQLEIWDTQEKRRIFETPKSEPDRNRMRISPKGEFGWVDTGKGPGTIVALRNLEPVFAFKDDDDRFRGFEWSKDEQFLATADNGIYRIRDARTGEILHQLDRLGEREGFNLVYQQLVWHPSGQALAINLGNRGVLIWRPRHNESLVKLRNEEQAVSEIEWSPDGTRLAVGYADGKVAVWNAGIGEQEHLFSDHKGRVRHISWSPSGEKIAASAGLFFTSSDKLPKLDRVIVRDVHNGRLVAAFDNHFVDGDSLAWSDNEKTLFWKETKPHHRSVEYDGISKTGDFVYAATISNGTTIKHAGIAGAFLFWDKDKPQIATQNELGIQFWSTETGALIRHIELKGDYCSPSPNRRFMICERNGSVVVTRISDGVALEFDAIDAQDNVYVIAHDNQNQFSGDKRGFDAIKFRVGDIDTGKIESVDAFLSTHFETDLTTYFFFGPSSLQ